MTTTLSGAFAMSVAVLVSVLGLAALLIWVERRLLGLWQERFGPNRVGPFGIFQSVADMIKMFTKEDWIPPFADRWVFVLAPTIVVITTLMSFAVVPFAPGIGVALGAGIGAAFGAAFDASIALSVAIGAAVGVVLGAVVWNMTARR